MSTRVLQRVEIDHSPLKVVVGTEAGPIGQPWLSLLIDYYSRMVVGFCLGFEPPSYAVLMKTLRHAILRSHDRVSVAGVETGDPRASGPAATNSPNQQRDQVGEPEIGCGPAPAHQDRLAISCDAIRS
ncbi:MAG: hypothetical protein NTY19_50590 [Planctomycetota bacterium]|nr:hypothetical protein [Planctomycetota bacterium]